jgi:predicted MPP superfamily phosphohydrolase
MRIGVFTLTVVFLLFLLAFLNSYWLGQLISPERRRKFRMVYAILTLLSAAAYLGIRVAGQFDGASVFSIAFYFGPFWTVLQLLLLSAWPVSKLLTLLLERWNSSHSDPVAMDSPTIERATSKPLMSRRAFLSYAAMAPPVAMTGVNTMGLVDAEFGVVLRHMNFVFAGLPPELEGLKIGHMTDVHIGPYVSVRDIQKMSALLQQAAPDLLAITGDLVDDVRILPAAMSAMQPMLSALPLGAWFCMGNHEHLRGAAPIRKILQQNGVNILDNQHKQLAYNGRKLFVAGVDYPMNVDAGARRVAAEKYLDVACATIPSQEFKLLLAHHPDFLPGSFARKVDLTLAGHTHGGQVGWGERSVFEFIYPYMRGVYQQKQSIGYVSSGAGHWLPFRLNCPPEVSLITLKRKA